MLRDLVSDVGDALGAAVYVAAYPIVFVGWHIVGRPVAKATKHILENSRQREVDFLLQEHASVEALKELFLRIYLNTLRQEQQERIAG
jgi:hypothetical protein